MEVGGEAGGLVILLIKENFWQKSFIDNFESNSGKLWKILSADVKADVKQWEIKSAVYTYRQNPLSVMKVIC